MNPLRTTLLDATKHLPNHHRLLKSSFQFFQQQSGVNGFFVGGALAAGLTDPFCTLDIGILFESSEARSKCWSHRNHWNIAPWIKYSDRSNKEIFGLDFYFAPNLRVDYRFYTKSDLPLEGPLGVLVGWDPTGHLDQWHEKVNSSSVSHTSWQQVIHEDERFWAWTHFSILHATRGEFHDVVQYMKDLRELVESWQTRLDGMSASYTRQTTAKYRPEFLERMKKTFCPPHSEGVREAFKNLIKIQLHQRTQIDRAFSPKWTVTASTISKIKQFSEEIAAF
jgi:hypothetical protein